VFSYPRGPGRLALCYNVILKKMNGLFNILANVSSSLMIWLLAFSGFMVARHIYKHKKPNQAPLVCPIKFDCHAVVHSDYSRFMGVPLEIFGMTYYALIFLSYTVLMFTPGAGSPPLVLFLTVLSSGAFVFSLYLVYVQLFILKKGCMWCFVSAFISILIFILTLLTQNLAYAAQIIAG